MKTHVQKSVQKPESRSTTMSSHGFLLRATSRRVSFPIGHAMSRAMA